MQDREATADLGNKPSLGPNYSRKKRRYRTKAKLVNIRAFPKLLNGFLHGRLNKLSNAIYSLPHVSQSAKLADKFVGR
jgi:hypothetical protein